MRRPPFAVAALLAAALLAGAILAPAAASPQPTPICPACGDAFERTAEEHGVAVDVRESTVLVQVHGNGSATWTIHNRLNTTDGFREDPAALDATVRQLVTETYGPPEDATLRDARLDGEVAVAVLHDPAATERHAGLLVVDYFHDEGREPRYHVNADQVTVRGPPGTTVANTPDSGSVDGRNVTWSGTGEGRTYRSPDLQGSPYVVFGAAGVSGLRTDAALALATLPIVVGAVQQFVLGQTLLFGGVLLGVTLSTRRYTFGRGPSTYGAALAVVGLLGAVVPAVVNGPGWVSVPALAAVGVGVAAVSDEVRGRRWTPGRLALLAGTALLLATATVFVLELAIDAPAPAAATGRSLGLALPFAACLPLGAALDRGYRETAAWVVVALVAFVTAALAVVDPVDPPTGLGGGVVTFFLTGFAVAVPLLGVLVLAVGRTLARPSSGTVD